MLKIKKKKKSMITALYGKIKERRGKWLIGANTQNVPYLSIAATQHKIRRSCIRHILIRVKACRHVRYVGASAHNLAYSFCTIVYC